MGGVDARIETRRAWVRGLAWSACLTACTAPSPTSGEAPQPGEPVPEELARLSMLVGTWEAESRAELGPGRVLRTTASVEADWDLRGSFVVARSAFRFQDETGAALPPSESETWYTWNAGAGRYEYWTFRSSGEVTTGTMRYDPAASTWTMLERAVDPATGEERIVGTGAMEYLTADEKLVRWEGRPLQGEPFRVTGKSRRVRRRAPLRRSALTRRSSGARGWSAGAPRGRARASASGTPRACPRGTSRARPGRR